MQYVNESTKKSSNTTGSASSTQSTQDSTGRITTPPIATLLEQFSSEGVLDANAAEYVGFIRKTLEDKAHPIPITTRKLRDNVLAFVSGEHAIILVIDNNSGTLYDITNGTAISDANNVFKMECPELNLVNIVSVGVESFAKYPQMAAYITRTLMAQVKGIELNKEQIAKNHKLVIDTDLVNVKRFVEQNSPHGVNCVEFGFIAKIVAANETNFSSANSANGKDFFAVAGYVEFIKSNDIPGSQMRFTPLVHISEIISAIPVKDILPLAISTAAEVFIGADSWKQAVMKFDKKGPNIGNLITVDNKPWRVNNAMELSEFFQKYVDPPRLCIDYVMGKANIPGLGRFTSNAQFGAIKADFGKFLGIDPNSLSEPSTYLFSEIVGIADSIDSTLSNTSMDSRLISYMKIINKVGSNASVNKLLFRSTDTLSRFNLHKDELGINVIPTNVSYVACLQGDFVRGCSAALSGIRPIIPNYINSQSVSLGNIQNYSTAGAFTISNVQSNSNMFII